MSARAGKKHNPETIERLRAAGRAQFADPARRKAHGALTRERMAAAKPVKAELSRLRDAWQLASLEARRRFLREVQASILEGPS